MTEEERSASHFRTQFRPTLIVGLGGTGHEVLIRVKARLLDTFGPDVFQIVKLLSFDTANEPISVASQSGRGDPIMLARGTELIDIGHVPVTQVLDNLEHNEPLKQWLPPDLPKRAISAGAQQVRPMGRLALFYHFEKVRGPIAQAVNDLSNINKDETRIGADGMVKSGTQGINVFVVTSACGGTGSGTFIDVAYLIRHLCARTSIEEHCYITGIIVLPEAFTTVGAGSEAIRANTFAALLELNHFSHEANFDVLYPGKLHIRSRRPPFTICYLVDAINERGRTLAGLPQLAPMIAETILLQSSSQIGEVDQARFDNIKVCSRVNVDGYPTAFSSVGTASLIFPAQAVIDVCAARYGVELIASENGLIERTIEDGRVKLAAEAFLQATLHLVTKENLLAELARNVDGKTMAIKLDGKGLNGRPYQETLQLVEKMLQDAEDRRFSGDIRKAGEAKLEDLQTRLITQLVDMVHATVDDKGRGIEFAMALLRLLGNHFDEMRETLAKERRELDERVDALQSGPISQHLAELRKALNTWGLGRQGQVFQRRDAYLSQCEQRFAARLDVRRHDLAASLLAQLSRRVEELSGKLSGLRNRIAGARDELRARSKQNLTTLASANPLAQFLLQEGDEERYYQEYTRDVGQQLEELLRETGGLYAWLDQDGKQILQWIQDVSVSVFRRIEEKRIEDLLKEKQDAKSIGQQLETLRQRSVPLWNIVPARMEDSGSGIESIVVIGVQDRSNSIFVGQERPGEELTSTQDRHAVRMLHTKHGVPISALQQFDEYRTFYDDHRQRKISPLHIFPMGDPEHFKMVFAVGEAFGFIKESGTTFTYTVPDEDGFQTLNEPQSLGQGLATALNNFSASTKGISTVERLIQKHVANVGKVQARKQLVDYINQELSPSPQRQALEKELRRLAKQYIEESLDK